MLPEQIEEKSFQLIEERVPSHSFDQKEWTIVRRMIHATVDFDLVHDTKFHPEAISKGIAALRKGAPIITDTKMVKAGMTSPMGLALRIPSFCSPLWRPSNWSQKRSSGSSKRSHPVVLSL